MRSSPFYDDLETREPEAREGALMARLPGLVSLAQRDAPGWARRLAGVDAAAVASRKALAALPEGSWQQLHLSLECFAKQGVDFAQVNNVFTLQSTAALKLSFYQLHIQPVTKLGADTVVLGCE